MRGIFVKLGFGSFLIGIVDQYCRGFLCYSSTRAFGLPRQAIGFANMKSIGANPLLMQTLREWFLLDVFLARVSETDSKLRVAEIK